MNSLEGLKERIQELPLIKTLIKRSFKGNVFLVGGAIREIFLSSIPHDYDFAITDEQDIKIFEEILSNKAFLIGKKPIHTYRIVKENTNIDLTLIEKDIIDDLKRRDFTINAIAYDIKEGVILDPLNGLKDLRKKVIVHIKKENLIHDPLRLIKAIRHFSILDGFYIHDELQRDISELRPLIKYVASERIKYELDQIICAKKIFPSLDILKNTGLLFEIFPELLDLKKFDEEKRLKPEILGHTIEAFKYLYPYGEKYGIDKKWLKITGYALLFHDLGKPHTFSYDLKKKLVHFFYHEKVSVELAILILERLRFSTNEIRQIKALIKNHMRIFLISTGNTTERAIRRVVFNMEELTPMLVLMTLCDMYGSSGGKDNESTEKVIKVCEWILSYYKKIQEEPLPKIITGYDLIDLGYKEGPEIGIILTEIKDRQITGEIKTKEEAIYYAKARLKMGFSY